MASLSTDEKKHRGAPFPENEHERVKFLQKLSVLDTIGEDAFDIITVLLTEIFKVPIALVSLVDSSRQWFKSSVGLDVKETPRDLSFCAHLLTPEDARILLVPDAQLDPRFQNSPLVQGDPFIRFYAGAPIILSGVRLGSLCIIDRKPRENTGQKDAMLLANFADIVAGLIDKERKQSAHHEMIDNPSFLVEVSAEDWPILYSNAPAKELLDLPTHTTPSFFDLFSFDQEVPSGCMLNETRAQEGWFGDRPCLCVFHPASRHGFGKDLYTDVLFPYAEPVPSPQPEKKSWMEPGRSFPSKECEKLPLPTQPTQLEGATDGGPHLKGREFNFVVIKWAKQKGEVSVGPSSSKATALIPLKNVNVIATAEQFDIALREELCIVLLTSQFCAACVHFCEFYGIFQQAVKGVKFNVLSVDDTPGIVYKCCEGAVFLPSVYFYNQGKMVDQLQGSNCAFFRNKLKTLVDGQATEAEDCGEMPQASTPWLMEGCVEGMCAWPEGSGLLYSDIAARLEAQRAYSRNLEALLAGSMATQLKELRKEHNSSLARLAALKQDLNSRRQEWQWQCSGRRACSASIAEDSELSEEDDEQQPGKFPQELPKYHFHGTVAAFLKPILYASKVLIYGGPRADYLEQGMLQANIDCIRQGQAIRNDHIPTEGRCGRTLAIVDVIDHRSPRATWEWFEKVSDALCVGGTFATISVDYDLLEVLGMFGETLGWEVTCTQGLKRDYGIIALTKGPNSDELLQAAV